MAWRWLQNLEHAVVGGRVGNGDPDAVALVGADHDVRLIEGGHEPRREVVVCPDPQEVALAWLQFPALGFQPCGQPRALLLDDGDPRLHLVGGVQRSDGGLLGQGGHGERKGGPAQSFCDVRSRHGVPHPQAGESVGLGERAQDADVRVLAVERQGVGAAACLGVFHVGLVDHHEDVGADGPEERLQAFMADGHAGRVVGGAEQDHLGPFGDGGGHGVEVVALGVVQRDADGPGTCQFHQDGVGLEGPPREDHFITGVAGPVMICWRTPTLPGPTATSPALTPRCPAILSRSSTAAMSG